MRLKFHISFGKVMRSKSMKMVFLVCIIRHVLCMIMHFFNFFVQKSFLTKNYFLTAERNLTTWGPLYTCLVTFQLRDFMSSYWFENTIVSANDCVKDILTRRLKDFTFHFINLKYLYIVKYGW